MDWNEALIDKVWEHARVLPEADPGTWRQDECGAWIRRDQFGHEHAEFGWKIERVIAGGVPDAAQGLRPFHNRNHYDVANGKAHCRATADRSGAPAAETLYPPRNRAV